MKIAIIGSGAMGSLYGAYLHKGGQNVYLIDKWQEHINTINKNGLIIEEKQEKTKVFPEAITSTKEVGVVDLLIVFVKSTKTEEAILGNKSIIGENTYVLTLQNGYGNAEKIEKHISKDKIIVGTTAEGCTMIKAGHIKHAGSGETNIGMFSGKEEPILKELVAILNNSGFHAFISEKPMELIWSKLIINVGINAITALLGIKNGQIVEQEYTKEIMKDAVLEAVRVAKAKGFIFNSKEIIKKVEDVALKTGENKSSMLQDVLNKRKTEIETINGAIVKEGSKLKISTPVNKTLTNLIFALENK